MIVTSVAPLRRGDARQHQSLISRAMESFEGNGFEVTSVNRESELEGLRALFPTVSFSSATESEGMFAGRYGPSLGALFDSCRHARVCGIVNADLYMLKVGLIDLLKAGPETFYVAHRVDVSADEAELVGVYRHGIDAIFFEPGRFGPVLDDRRLRGFQLGAPFWDIVTPILASFHGRVSFIEPPFILHRAHAANWSSEDYAVLKEAAVETVVEHAKEHAATSPQAARFLAILEAHGGDIDRSRRSRHGLRNGLDVLDAWLQDIEAKDTTKVHADAPDGLLARLAMSQVGGQEIGESVPDGPRKRSDPISLGLRRLRLRKRRQQLERLRRQFEA